MSRMGDALISCWEAGTVPVELEEVRAWRAAGHDVPLRFVPVTNWQGRKVPMPAVALATAQRLAEGLDDEQSRQMLRAAIDDAMSFVSLVRSDEIVAMEVRAARSCVSTAARLAGEIVAAIARGDELPDEWHRYDTYADVGEPTACEVVRLVREELAHTSIRP